MTESLRYVQLFVPMVWVGMVAAISFLEAPLKFRAPGVTTALGLGIGRLVFKALNVVEVVLLVVLIATCVVAPPNTLSSILLACVAVVLGVQLLAVRPPLNKRSDRVLAGEVLPRSRMHLMYVALEAAKIALLVALAVSLAAAVVVT